MSFGSLVEIRQPRPIETLGQGTDTRTDGHLVVVEDDQQVFPQSAGIVECFKNDARRQRSIPDNCHAMAVVLTEQIIAHLETEGAGNAAAGMAGHEQVVGAFVRIGIAHQSAAPADGVELFVTSGDELMWINLMSSIPNKTVAAEIEGQVQGQAQLDDAKIAGEMSRANAEDAHHLVAHFLGKVE